VKAVTRRLDTDVDLLEAGDLLFERNRLGLAGRGVAARVPLDDVDRVLASIEIDDEVNIPGCRPPSWSSPQRSGAAPTTAPAGTPQSPNSRQ
jgi:hypothetical protein